MDTSLPAQWFESDLRQAILGMGHGNLHLSLARPLPHGPTLDRLVLKETRFPYPFPTRDPTLFRRENPFQPLDDLSPSIPPLFPLLVLPHSENLVRNDDGSFNLSPNPSNFGSDLCPFDSLFDLDELPRRWSDLYWSSRRILERRTRRFRSFVHDDPLFNVPL